MSTLSNPQSVQQPDIDQAINDEVINLADQSDFSADEEMTDTDSDSDKESSQKEEPQSKRLKGGIRDYFIHKSSEIRLVHGKGSQQSALDVAIAASSGVIREAQQHKFHNERVEEYPWLRMTPTGNLFCNACSLRYNKPVLLKNYKVYDFIKHRNTAKHHKAMAAYQGGEYDDQAAATTSALKKVDNSSKKVVTLAGAYANGLGAMRQKQFQNKLIQFMTIFQLLKHHRPISDYEWHLQTLNAHPVISETIPEKHVSRTAGWEIADAMNAVVLRHTKSKIEEATFFSLSIDASAALDTTDYLNIESRFWHDLELHLGFVCMTDIGEDPSAAGQKKVMLQALQDYLGVSLDVLKKKLVAVASDGCNTMQGNNGGLLTLLQNECPHMLKISCTAHSVNLAAEILDKLPFFKRISDAIRMTSSYFHRSPKRTAVLKKYQEEFGLPQLRLITVNDTRWMPINEAMENLLRILPAVIKVLDLDRKDDAPARTLLYELTSAPVLFGMFAVKPLLSSLDVLTKLLQTSHLYPGDVAEAVENCISTIDVTYLEDKELNMGLKWKQLQDLIEFQQAVGTSFKLLPSNNDVFIKIGSSTISIKELPEVPPGVPQSECSRVRGKMSVVAMIEEAKKAAEVVKTELKRRLPTTELMKAICLITPRYWMQLKKSTSSNELEMLKHVQVDLHVLLKQFAEPKLDVSGNSVDGLVSKIALTQQFLEFYGFMKLSAAFLEAKLERPGDRVVRTKTEIFELAGREEVERLWGKPIPDSISEYYRLAKLILSIPFGSVANERRFSGMNLDLTALRNRLEEMHLNTCMRLAASPYVVENFPYQEAFECWLKEKERRGLDA